MSTDKWEEKIAARLKVFDPISLEEMDDVKLLTRNDSKFLIPLSKTISFLEGMEEHYKVLKVANCVLSPYETVYFDTSGFSLYNDHHNGKAARCKLRYRKYSNTDVTFFEVKKKNNKGVTQKLRIPCDRAQFPFPEKVQEFIKITTGTRYKVQPKITITYNRVTLVSKTNQERITLDVDLRMNYDGNVKCFGPAVIVEVKQVSHEITPVIERLREMKVSQSSLSKYCFAVSKLVPHVRSNNFKPNFRQIEKLIHENQPA